MCVTIRGHQIQAHVQPIHAGYFLRSPVHEMFGVQPGSILEVDGRSCIVRDLIAGDSGDPEVWAILLPVQPPPSKIDRTPAAGRISSIPRSIRTRFSFPPGT